MLTGSHVSMSDKKMLQGSAEKAHRYGESTFMIYTGVPQNTRRKDIENLNIERGQQAVKAYGSSSVVIHVPYIINIANTIKPEIFNLGVGFLQEETERTQTLGVKDVVLHPGAHAGVSVDKGVQKIIGRLNEMLTHDNDVGIVLETMAGKRVEVGRSLEETAQIIDGVMHGSRLSICFDTYHTHDAGYNVKEDFDSVLGKPDSIVGVDRIKVVHVNDNKNLRDTQKDRHENISFGHTDSDALSYIVHHGTFRSIPKILETPYVGKDKKNKKSPYKLEVNMLESQKFDLDLKNETLAQ